MAITNHPADFTQMIQCYTFYYSRLIQNCGPCGPEPVLTRGTVVHQGSQGLAIPPVAVEVVDRELGHLVLDPAEQTLLRGQLLGVLIILIFPHGHRNGVVEDEGPDQTQNELQVPVHNGFRVWQRGEKGDRFVLLFFCRETKDEIEILLSFINKGTQVLCYLDIRRVNGTCYK